MDNPRSGNPDVIIKQDVDLQQLLRGNNFLKFRQ